MKEFNHKILIGLFSFCLALLFSIEAAPFLSAQQKFGNLPQYIRREHFIIYHDNKILASTLIKKAEYYYRQILKDLGAEGFTPFNQKPCPIYLYKNKRDYIESTHAPGRSSGIARYNPPRFATYEGVRNFKDTIFPHELTHLLLFILMEGRPIPLWFNEGLAQYEEADFGRTKNPYLKRIIKSGRYIKLGELFDMQIYPEDKQKIDFFYLESASMVEFLEKEVSGEAFDLFLLKIKQGLDTKAAIREAYGDKFSDIETLEERWIEFIEKCY